LCIGGLRPDGLTRPTISAIPSRVTGRGAVRPIHLGDADKGVAAADAFVFAGAASPFEGSGAAHCVALIAPTQISLVAIRVGDDAVAARLTLLLVEVEII
jgi:hypothetical protein